MRFNRIVNSMPRFAESLMYKLDQTRHTHTHTHIQKCTAKKLIDMDD